ncbi:hypothetical protein AAFC00_006604 [Neodothiora populina]|uniref:F-box domain-containing protein n=1 Tax=Neodothiora populina TaxID=2781224 RepID=A0ABR3PAK2_9PEZI
MDQQQQPHETEAELERFRRQWQEEVSRRNRQNAANAAATRPDRRKQQTSASSASRAPARRGDGPQPDEEEQDIPHAYHDLPNKEAHLRLDAADHGLERGRLSRKTEPQSALEHYERAVEKETQGSLGDSLNHYRKAFKLDDGVHEQYKNKHFPPSSFPPKRPTAPQQPQQPSQSNSAAKTNPSTSTAPAAPASNASPTPSIPQLVEDFSQLSIPGAPAPTDADPPPPCPIANLPGELLTEVLTHAALHDLASLSRIAQVCKRFAYLVMTDEQVWRRIAQGPEYGFAAMHYDYVCDLRGEPVDDYSDLIPEELDIEDIDNETQLLPPRRRLRKTTPEIDTHLLTTLYRSSWRQMFRQRPRLRFNGCYISTVNYTRPGAASTDTRTWGTPIHIVTYFRYLRFYRDGTVISLLTTAEPIDVVHHLAKENLRKDASTTTTTRGAQQYASGGGGAGPSILANSVMKDALRGRWHLSGPGDGSSLDSLPTTTEAEGDVHIETDGVVPKYMWKMQFSLGGSSSKSASSSRSNKLSWKGFWSYNKLTDDWGEFGLKNDKPFYFSRVKGYGRVGA